MIFKSFKNSTKSPIDTITSVSKLVCRTNTLFCVGQFSLGRFARASVWNDSIKSVCTPRHVGRFMADKIMYLVAFVFMWLAVVLMGEPE